MSVNLSPFGNNHIAISCDCHSPDHVFLFHHDAWEGEEPVVYLYVQLNPWFPWWKRAWLAVKYLFNRTAPNYGHWDCTMVSGANVLKLRDFCDVVVSQNVEFKLGGCYESRSTLHDGVETN